MAWDEAQYVIDEILNGMETGQTTGIPPQNLKTFSVSAGNQQIKIKCTPPADTIIDGQLICTVAGVKIIRKAGKAPTGPEDGTLVLDVLRGQNIEATDGNLTNGVTYYYGFFPYSDHGVYNYNQVNVKAATPSAIKYWAFDQNFADKDPNSTISYPAGFANSDFAKMHTNEDTGTATAGGWLDFLQNTLKNFPFMVAKTGRANYALNPNDYTKKSDGTGSDYNNADYNGGAFAWLNKIYMREDYSSDGETRRVQFADGPADGYTPVGFYDPDGNVMEGIWIPMGYMDGNGRTLIAGPSSSIINIEVDQEWELIKTFSSRGAFLGGPIMHVLRDLEYMMFKSTDIQSAAGYGRCNAGTAAGIAGQVVANGAVPGWKGTSDKKTMNKYFHSQVLGSYQEWLRDPYSLLINGTLKMSDRYIYDLSGAKLIDTGLSYPTFDDHFSCHLVKVGDTLGSELKDENTGSTSTGICDILYANSSGTRVGGRLGTTWSDMKAGPAALDVASYGSYAHWSRGVGVILLPPVGYAPST